MPFLFLPFFSGNMIALLSSPFELPNAKKGNKGLSIHNKRIPNADIDDNMTTSIENIIQPLIAIRNIHNKELK